VAWFAGLTTPPPLSIADELGKSITSETHSEFERELQALLRRNKQRVERQDGDWFSLSAPSVSIIVDETLDRSLATVSEALLARFASRLGAFSESSYDYLCRNFLACDAELAISEDRVVVHFLTCPLQTVLRMAGFDDVDCRLPWLGWRTLEFRFY
jgi:hypothetical protein